MKLGYAVGKIAPYRLPFFEELFSRMESGFIWRWAGNDASLPSNVEQVCFERKSFGRFYWIKGLVRTAMSSGCGAVVVEYNANNLSAWWMLIMGRFRGIPVHLHGIGPRKPGWKAGVMAVMGGLSKGVLLYEQQAKDVLISISKLLGRKVAVIHNTQWVECCARSNVRESHRIIYVGALTKRKDLFDLVQAVEILSERGVLVDLLICGNGDERKGLVDYVACSEWQGRIQIVEPTFDPLLLNKLFHSAAVACSPGQAGLFILQAFGNGVPFVTRVNAVTGGEIENVRSGVNGILYSGSAEDLADVLQGLLEDPVQRESMSIAAYEHYWGGRTIAHMADRFISGMCT